MRLLGITSIRSDYDLLSPLYRILNDDNTIDFRLLVSGAHLSSTYGSTINYIERDGLPILARIESLLDSNTKASRLKSASIFLLSAIDTVSEFSPDLIIYAGDREDVIIAALIGTYLNIPTLHFYGGDHTKTGHVDDHIRHAVSKLSSIHFVSTEEHKNRLLKIGESSGRIFVIGSITLDKFKDHTLLSDKIIAKFFTPKPILKNYAIVIFHPVQNTSEPDKDILKNILDALIILKIPAYISFPNTDPGNRDIILLLEEYSRQPQFIVFQSLERDIFLSIYKKAKFQIGNSSSGIMEAASIPIPVINVGQRQQGRTSNQNVIFCGITPEEIGISIEKAISFDFLIKIKGLKNLYGNGESAQLAYNIIKKTDFSKLFFKTEDPLNL